jgi:hypothetical protein
MIPKHKDKKHGMVLTKIYKTQKISISKAGGPPPPPHNKKKNKTKKKKINKKKKKKNDSSKIQSSQSTVYQHSKLFFYLS